MEQSSLVKLKNNYDVDIVWRGFELHPETPLGGIPLTSLFPGKPIARIRARVESFANEFGVDMTVPEHISNTRRALAISEYARDQGKLDAYRVRATHAYWVDGLDLEDDKDLAHIARESGLDEVEALAASTDADYLARVQSAREEGIERMVTGVPTLYFGEMPVVGCQRYETFEKVAKIAGLTPRAS
jgi:predicted DsbA family dithiol-disulfide isomerase